MAFGGIGYAFLSAIALFVFSFIGKKVRQEYPDGLTIGDYLKKKLHPLGYWIMICILLLTSLHILYIQSMTASTLFHFLFNLPLYIEIIIFITFCVLFAGFGGLKMIHGLAGFQVIILSVIIGAIIFFATIIQSKNMIELLFYSGNVYSALLFPILVIVLSKSKVGNYIPISIVISIILSYIIQPYVGKFQSIWLSLLFSIVIIIFGFTFQFFSKKESVNMS